MSELEDIRKRRMEELQQNYAQENTQQEAQIQEQINQIEAVVKQRFTKEALQRYSNIKAADPEKASQLLLIIAQFLQAGKINQIDDETLKNIIIRVTPKKREMKITRK
ncbi:DNA-binding protein [candidate division KSB1 bacterium]